jgi:hypothetical protein
MPSFTQGEKCEECGDVWEGIETRTNENGVSFEAVFCKTCYALKGVLV